MDDAPIKTIPRLVLTPKLMRTFMLMINESFLVTARFAAFRYILLLQKKLIKQRHGFLNVVGWYEIKQGLFWTIDDDMFAKAKTAFGLEKPTMGYAAKPV